MTQLRFETKIAAAPDVCVDLALTVETHLDYPGSRERIVDGVTSGRMQLGDVVTWESKRFGLRMRMTSKIIELESPDRFVDEMQKGPFARWRHVHTFTPVDGGTLMVDEVDYAVPFGVFGWIADRLFVRRYMTQLATELTSYIRTVAEATVERKG